MRCIGLAIFLVCLFCYIAPWDMFWGSALHSFVVVVRSPFSV
jgi:hypothetical protein